MNSKSHFPLSFDPDAWELSVVAHRPRTWLPVASRPGQIVNPRWWQSRAARGLTWNRTGRAPSRKPVR
jgi:hypothetical protein